MRKRREDLKKGLREMAGLLDVAPAHLTDLEKGRRSPSEDLLMRISEQYGIDQATLRAGWGKPEEIVREIASQDATTAAKVPEFLRSARRLSPSQWDRLIDEARRLGKKSKRS
jgi:transcriptional regulator with XRE-family HTH domain